MSADDIKISKNNFEMVQPIVTTARIFGLCPFHYQDCGNFYIIRWSKLWAVYGFVSSVILATLTFLGLLVQAQEGVETEDDEKKNILVISDMSIVLIIFIFCVLKTPSKLRTLKKIFDTFNEIEKLVIIDDTKLHRRNSTIWIASFLSTFAMIYIYDTLTWHWHLEKISGLTVFLEQYLAVYLLNVFVLNQILLYCHVVYFTRIRIRSMNDYIEKTSMEDVAVVSEFKNGEFNVLGIGRRTTMVEALRDLARCHRKIHQIVNIINNTSDFGIAIIMLCILLRLTISPYFFLTEIEKGGSVIFSVLQLVWIMAYLGKFFVLMESCQRCVDEALRTKTAILNLLLGDVPYEVQQMLIEFTTQVNYCEIKFNVCGLFNIDRSILVTFIATITTYVVIVFQINHTVNSL